MQDKQPIYPGTAIIITASFTKQRAPFAPATAVAKVHKPSGGAALTPAVTQLAANRFEATFVVDEPGLWTYRWESTGPGQAAREQTIKVEKSAFA